jgi:hypothetical protein
MKIEGKSKENNGMTKKSHKIEKINIIERKI